MTTKLTRQQVESMPAGREMDGWIADKIIGLSTDPILHKASGKIEWSPGAIFYPQDHWEYPEIPSYSTDIAAAWQVVEKLNIKFFFQLSKNTKDYEDGIYTASFHDLNLLKRYGEAMQSPPKDAPTLWIAQAPTAPLAICRAALMTLLK